MKPEKKFGSRPKNEKPENEKLNITAKNLAKVNQTLMLKCMYIVLLDYIKTSINVFTILLYKFLSLYITFYLGIKGQFLKREDLGCLKGFNQYKKKYEVNVLKISA